MPYISRPSEHTREIKKKVTMRLKKKLIPKEEN